MNNAPLTQETASQDSGGARPFEAPVLPALIGRREHERESAERSARLRDQGYLDGHAAGWAAAQHDISVALADHRRSAERLGSVADALGAAVAELERRDGVALAAIQTDVVALAARLAAEILGRELRTIEHPVVEALDRAAALRPERGDVVIRVHADDLATADEAVAADLLHWPDGARVVADPSIEPGGCVAEVGSCRIDAQIGPALERMCLALDPAGPSTAISEIRATSVQSELTTNSRTS
jgi:flagellar assembly protein FliH